MFFNEKYISYVIEGKYLEGYNLDLKDQYLLNYFSNVHKRIFLYYYLLFESFKPSDSSLYSLFIVHTGLSVTRRNFNYWVTLLKTIRNLESDFIENSDLESLAKLKSGSMKQDINKIVFPSYRLK